jgi:hypothetical protein
MKYFFETASPEERRERYRHVCERRTSAADGTSAKNYMARPRSQEKADREISFQFNLHCFQNGRY